MSVHYTHTRAHTHTHEYTFLGMYSTLPGDIPCMTRVCTVHYQGMYCASPGVYYALTGDILYMTTGCTLPGDALCITEGCILYHQTISYTLRWMCSTLPRDVP